MVGAFQAILGLSSKVNVEALKDRILAACRAGEIAGSNEQATDAMEAEVVMIKNNRDLGPVTVVVPRFKLRLTVSILDLNIISCCTSNVLVILFGEIEELLCCWSDC